LLIFKLWQLESHIPLYCSHDSFQSCINICISFFCFWLFICTNSFNIDLEIFLMVPNRQKNWKNACKRLKHVDWFWMLIEVPDCHPNTFRKMRRENDHFLHCLKLLTVCALQIFSRCYTYFLYTVLNHNREPRLVS
jgi:hypothetical protein